MPHKTRGKTSAIIVQAACNHRRQPTAAENRLWDALRGRRLAGLKVRREHPYENFILDAFCVEYQIEIEVDGDIHQTAEQKARDSIRTEFLKSRGIRVLRFSNEDIDQNLPLVLQRILEALKT